MDYEQTSLIYKNLGQEKKFQEKPEVYQIYNKEKGWYEKVNTKRTGEYNQAEDLINLQSAGANLIPDNWKPPHIDKEGKPVKYPIKHVNEIIRKRLPNGTEWLLSRQEWIALDAAGNEINLSMVDKEMYDDVLPVYALKPENPVRQGLSF
jgi:hypothetical protein